jgi:hypothetical protein
MRGEPTTSELQALAARQQQQLDTQARLIAAREHRLRQVKKNLQQILKKKKYYCLERNSKKNNSFDFRVCVFGYVVTKWFWPSHCLQCRSLKTRKEKQQFDGESSSWRIVFNSYVYFHVFNCLGQLSSKRRMHNHG